MTIDRRHQQIDVLRAWLQRVLGDHANIYHQNSADPVPDASAAERFSISVPVADSIGLVWLRKQIGAVRGSSQVLIVIQIEPEGVLQAQGRIARRNFVIHFREAA